MLYIPYYTILYYTILTYITYTCRDNAAHVAFLDRSRRAGVVFETVTPAPAGRA
jgi:hypothetical protein